MASILILTPKPHKEEVEKQTNDIICECNKTKLGIEDILDRTFCTTCPKCIAKFMEDISELGLFRFDWEPRRFRRGEAEFFYETSKYLLQLKIVVRNTELRLVRHLFPTHFAGLCYLKITNKLDRSKSKNITLFDLHCDSEDKTTKQSYIVMMKDYIEKTFGIDFTRWNEIVDGQKDVHGNLLY